MRKLTCALSLLSVLLLAACGGGASLGDGGGDGSSLGGSTTGGTTGGSTGSGVPADITIEAAQTSIVADGQSTSLLTATLTDTDGVAIKNKTLDFETNAGSLTAATVTTNASGQAITRLKAGISLGRATVTVREPGSGLSASVNVVLTSGPAAHVAISLAPGQVRPAGTTSVDVLVTDSNALPVSGELVSLGATSNLSGGTFAATLLTTDDNGRATTTYQAGPSAGIDKLQASLAAAGVNASANLTVSASATTVTGIALTLGSSTVIADGTSTTTLSAKVTDSSGAAVPGSTVNFGTTAGTLLAPSAITGTDGVAQVSLKSPVLVGTADVTASTSGLSDTKTVTFIPGAVNSIALSAAPATVQPGGTSAIRATAFDANGNRVPGVTISFRLPTASVNNGGRFSAASVSTDANGEAATQYIAPTSGTTDTINAKSTSGVSAPPLTITISNSTAVVTGLSLESAITSVTAGGDVIIRATVNTSGSLGGIPVNFSTSAGSLSSTTAQTDATGVAAVHLTAPNNLTAVQLSATTGNFSAQTQVQVVAGAPDHATIAVASSPVVPGGSATISAQILDAHNNPVTSQTVQFRFAQAADNATGASIAPASAVSDSNGNVSTTYQAGTTNGVDTVTLTFGNGKTQIAPITVDSTAKPVGGITLSVANSSTTAGASQTVVATVKDAGGNVLSGVQVSFAATAGSFAPPTAPAVNYVTNAGGQVSVRYTAPTTVGTAVLTGSSGGYSASQSVTVTGGAATTVTVNAAPGVVAPNHASSIVATVTDSNGNSLANHTVSFKTSAGQFSNGATTISATTDASGVSTQSLTGPASGTATVTVTAKPENVDGTTTVSIDASAAVIGGITVTALTTSIPADGSSTAIVRAHVTDTSGSALVGQAVHFASSAGSPVNADLVTNAGGDADFQLTAATVLGSATVTGTAGGFSKSATVTFTAGAPKTLNLTLNPSTVTGGTTAAITASVVDANGNPVPGVNVKFSVPANNSGGALGNVNVSTDANGVATTTYTPGIPPTMASLSDTIRAETAVAAASDQEVLTVTNAVKSVALFASSTQLLSSASTAAQGVTMTALVKDQNNNVLSGIPVQFVAKLDPSSCGTGGALQVTQGTTNAAGQAIAVLTTGGDPTNQLIDVTATAAGISSKVPITETGTTISVTGPASVGLGAKQSYTISFKDAGNNPISNQVLSVVSLLGNTVSAHAGSSCSGGNCTTNANGQFAIDYTGTNGGSDTLTVEPQACSSGTTVAKQAIQVASQTLTIVAPADDAEIPFSANLSAGAELAAGGSHYVAGDVLTVSGGTFTTPAQLTVSSVDAVTGAISGFTVSNAGDYTALPTSPAATVGGNGTGATFTVWQNITVRLAGGTVTGQTISFNTTRGTLSATTAATNASGIAQVQLDQASAAGNAGGAVVTATCTTCSPNISASTSIQFNATIPASVALQASPSTVSVSGTSVITATVRDANDNPVASQSVNFTLTDDSGGALQQSTAVTNSGGQATITYKGGSTTGSKNGVKITGTTVVGGVNGSTTLTVGGQALRIVLGTGNTITPLNSTQYQLPYSVLVTDSAGNPPPAGSVVNLTINASAYQKGYEAWDGTQWTVPAGSGYLTCAAGDPGCADTGFGCANEDLNFNGILDTSDNDFNHNGVLEPGNPASVPASVTLDSNGTGQFNITYPKDRAYWVQVGLRATITVNGDQGSTAVTFVLPGLSGDFTVQTVSPPGQFSPYGQGASCADPN